VKKILVSECLCGGRAVRYNGGAIPLGDPRFLKWKAEGRLVPICPEVAGEDVTKAYVAGAEKCLRLASEQEVAFAVMKQSSPSCGSKLIYDEAFTDTKKPGQGLATEGLRNAMFSTHGRMISVLWNAALTPIRRSDLEYLKYSYVAEVISREPNLSRRISVITVNISPSNQ
jgi:uncharacterized protein YbbK (DUF523 family)